MPMTATASRKIHHDSTAMYTSPPSTMARLVSSSGSSPKKYLMFWVCSDIEACNRPQPVISSER